MRPVLKRPIEKGKPMSVQSENQRIVAAMQEKARLAAERRHVLSKEQKQRAIQIKHDLIFLQDELETEGKMLAAGKLTKIIGQLEKWHNEN